MSACRICLEEEGEMIQPCLCKGTAKDVHPECLQKWLTVSGKRECEICKHPYKVDDTIEFVCTPIPTCRLSDSSPFPVILCTLMLFTMQTFVLLSGYDPMLVMLGVNVAQVLLLYLLQAQICPLPSWCLWKVFSTLSFIAANVMFNTWLFVFYEAGTTCILMVYTYIYLVYTQSYHNLQYIYYEEMP